MSLTPFVVASATYVVMLLAYFLPRKRYFHIPAMIAVIIFDLGVPFYLYTHRDWWKQMILQQEIFSPLVWMHGALFIALYALEATQIYTARKILKGDQTARADHRSQGKALLVVRGMVILSGAILGKQD
jgi:hypothetical protein